MHGTLIDKGGVQALERARAKVVSFLNHHGISVTHEGFKQIWLSNREKHRMDYKELNEVSFYGWYKGILDDLGISNPDESWVDHLNEEWMRGFIETTTEIPPARAVLSELKHCYRLGVISNSLGRNTEVDLLRTSLRNFFEVLIFSSEVGKRKPHPKIFASALDAMGLRAEETIMVGDNFHEDIEGAKKMGMKTIYLTQKEPSRSIEFLKNPSDFNGYPNHREKECRGLAYADAILESLNGVKDLISDW